MFCWDSAAQRETARRRFTADFDALIHALIVFTFPAVGIVTVIDAKYGLQVSDGNYFFYTG